MERERLDQWLERGILLLVLMILVFAPLAFGAVRATEFAIITALTLGVLGLWLIRLWLAPQTHLLWPPICWAVLAFVAYALVRSQYTVVAFDAQVEVQRIVVYAALFFAVLNNLYRQDSTKLVSLVLVGVGLGLALYAVSQFLSNSIMVLHLFKPAGYVGRGSGTFVNPNHLAGHLEMILPLAIVLSLASRLSHAAKIFAGYSALAMLAGIAVTMSRGGWLATALVLLLVLVILVQTSRYRFVVLILTLALAAGGYFFLVSAQQRVQRRIEDAMKLGHERDVRWRIWPAAVKVWLQNPWWGAGPGHFDHYYRQYREPMNRTQSRPVYAHNEYLNTLADYGAVGALLVAGACVMLFGGALRSWRAVGRSSSGQDDFKGNKCAFVLGGALGLLGVLIHSFTDFQFHIPANAILAVTLMALLSSHLRFATESYWLPLQWIGKTVVTVLLVAVGIYLGLNTWQRAKQEIWVARATGAPDRASQLAAWQRALEIDPQNWEAAYQRGEFHRVWSWEGDPGYEAQAREAMFWFKQTMTANPLDPFSRLHYGMCLHWLGRHQEAGPYFEEALALDPNNYYVLAQVGWHYFQLRQYAAAKQWFLRSYKLNWWDNPTVGVYWPIAEQRLRAP